VDNTALFESEYRVITAAGELIWILDRGAVVARDESGVPLRMASTQINITQRKLAEIEVRESEQRFAIFLTPALPPRASPEQADMMLSFSIAVTRH